MHGSQHPGQPPVPDPAPGAHPDPPHGYPLPGFPPGPVAPSAAHQMPGVVRTAQVLLFVGVGFFVFLAVLAGLADDSRSAGQVIGTGLFWFVGAGCAFRFGSGKHATRVTAIVVASMAIATGLGSMREQPTGPTAILAIVVVVLLSQRTTGDWFRRPR
ncbi:hypothetical protein [Streptomyces buecherae]|uniref:Uncharacterized protein n=1 Tax=Streptomyces buecherae TaxID=2763006 RepID=A0A7H8NCS5_9ACTN|nr:hypothetical protein [Streptomyces buecherae]QKW52290.1 hypothetical protein HUT08_25210 [Streptomyces buecherae]